MSSRSCLRSWQVEASLDARLSATTAASFERHLGTCEDCRQERAALLRLQSLAERLPTATSTPLRRRALQQQLLSRANALLVGSAEPTEWRRWGALALACVVLVLLLGVGSFWAWSAHTTPTAVTKPHFELSTTPGTRFRVVESGATTRLACDDGKLEVSVHKLLPGQRFIINLPDGELEVRGTRFVLEVAQQRTRRLSVSEGTVELHFQGKPKLLVGAGEAWSKLQSAELSPAPSAAPVVAKPAEETPPPVDDATSHARPPRPTAARAAAPRQPAPDPPSSAATPAPSSSVTDYVEAMAAFSKSDWGTAEELLVRFEQRYPDSPHREDVLFLQAVCRSRRGDAAGARILAQQYLRRYPHGFRAPEATQLAAP
ncbi:MAG TPA: tetratricopeptide repeat protein [Polyangiaceae bacterium]|nr:tetratricopeptide repeat protein [Polyangiaceae bacterium]